MWFAEAPALRQTTYFPTFFLKIPSHASCLPVVTGRQLACVFVLDHAFNCCVLLRTTREVGMMMCGWSTSPVVSASTIMRTDARAIS